MSNSSPLKLDMLILSQIRGFEHFELDLRGDKDLPASWAVLLGDNGVGKTTILRSIALALGDRDHAATLLRDSQVSWVREGAPKKEGWIRVRLSSSSDPEEKYSVEIKIDSDGRRETIGYHSMTPPEGFPLDRIFVCGYGAARGIDGTEDYSYYRVIDAVYSLFQYDTRLQNPELMLLRVAKSQADEQRLLKQLDRLMMLPPGSTNLGRSGIKINGPWGDDMPLKSLGDGYRSSVTWLADLFGWALYFAEDDIVPENLTGIVLIDEVDQHLHPRWQRRIISLLKEQLPNVQFIATSHSPVSTLGTTDLDDDDCVIVSLSQEGSNIVGKTFQNMPRGMRVDQILTALFGLTSVSDDATTADILRLAQLDRSTRTAQDDQERDALIEELSSKLGTESTFLQNLVKEILSAVLAKKVEEIEEVDRTTLELEISRQISALTGRKEES